MLLKEPYEKSNLNEFYFRNIRLNQGQYEWGVRFRSSQVDSTYIGRLHQLKGGLLANMKVFDLPGTPSYAGFRVDVFVVAVIYSGKSWKSNITKFAR